MLFLWIYQRIFVNYLKQDFTEKNEDHGSEVACDKSESLLFKKVVWLAGICIQRQI